MEILTFPLTPFVVNCFVIKDGGEALVIDPGDVSQLLFRSLDGMTVHTIVNTHGHCDHCGGNAEMIRRTGAQLIIHSADLPLLQAIEAQGKMFGVSVPASPEPQRFLHEGEILRVGSAEFTVVHTPGHSPGHIVLVGDGLVIAGDVLFAGSIGRTDLPGGDYHQLMESIRTKILTLPDKTVVYPGHGPATTVGEERRSNPFLADL